MNDDRSVPGDPPTRGVPPLPYDELRSALDDHPEGRAHVDELHAQMQSDTPDRGRIEEHVSGLRGIEQIEATVANWWDSPEVQRFVNNLTNAGL